MADDEKVDVEFFQVMLTKLGYTVETAYNGQEVLEKIPVFHPDVLLLDLVMPKLNGFQVARKLKTEESTADIPIIVLSAISDIDKKVDMLELGIDDYIIKPFNFIEILARIRNALRQKRMREELLYNREKLACLDRFEHTLMQFIENARSDSECIVHFLEVNAETRDGAEGCEVFERGKRLLQNLHALENTYAQMMR
ncbi:MAG: response regulator transcription factor [Spirochaetota bacterium]